VQGALFTPGVVGHSWTGDAIEAARVERLGLLVTDCGGPVEALHRLEAAELVARRLAGECDAKGWHGAARGYVGAAEHLRSDQRLLVELYA